MIESASNTIRLWEWGHKHVPDLSPATKEALESAAAIWRADNHLNVPPISFTGVVGSSLEIHAKQFVGVIEAHGVTVEIFPKLDAHILDEVSLTSDADSGSVMRSLLWMLDVSGHKSIVDADAASLEEVPSRFLDLFTLVFARQLRRTLSTRGLARRYETEEGDLRGVRGRIQVNRQVSQNWNRMDKLACTWDEFTADTAVNRLLRTACKNLVTRVRHREATWLLSDCLAMLDDVSDVSPPVALRETLNLRAFDRGAWEHFRRPFLLGRRLLGGLGHQLAGGAADTFVFLLDMNKVFESYARAVLEARFNVTVHTQTQVGSLLHGQRHSILQKADFVWQVGGQYWIGDAKYKHLAKGRNDVIRFENLATADSDAEFKATASHVLSPDDVRQLTVYAELWSRSPAGRNSDSRSSLALIYPFVGTEVIAEVPREMAWNGSMLYLVPLRVRQIVNLADAMPAF